MALLGVAEGEVARVKLGPRVRLINWSWGWMRYQPR